MLVMKLTEEQVRGFSPDDSSTKSGLQLANKAKWVSLNMSENAVWGKCQGSGKEPYSTAVDLQQIAFKCSCPSRKFPCKHGLGILFLYASHPDWFTPAEPDEITQSWLNKREAKKTEVAEKPAKPVDEKSREKKAEQRSSKITAGLEELEIWMKDIIRNGIQNLPENAYQFTQRIIPRMVDAQAPGLAARLRKLSEINFYQAGWELQFLHQFSTLYLLIKSYQNADQLEDDWKKELQIQAGWTITKEEVLLGPTIEDTWFTLHVQREQLDKLWSEKIWFYGLQSKRKVYLLNFFANNQPSDQLFLPGSYIAAAMTPYPSVHGGRVLIKNRNTPPEFTELWVEDKSQLAQIPNVISDTFSLNPFIGDIGFVLHAIHIIKENRQWKLADKDGNTVNIHNTEHECLKTLAFSQGHAFSCFVLYNPEGFQLASYWSRKRLQMHKK